MNTDIKACLDALRMLKGLPPHDEPTNICRGDGYFAKSIEGTYDAKILVMCRRLIAVEVELWAQYRALFIRGSEARTQEAVNDAKA